jgi:hypothetical protein
VPKRKPYEPPRTIEISLCAACNEKMDQLLGTAGADGIEISLPKRSEFTRRVQAFIMACPTCGPAVKGAK